MTRRLPVTGPAAAAHGWSPSARNVLSYALRPPVRDVAFWAIQVTVVALAGLHLYLDSISAVETTNFRTGSPVALLLVPVLYSALRYGLAGAAATALWATLLWVPDLMLPNALGHPVNDLIDLAIVDAVAVFVGGHIERGRIQRRRAETAERQRHNAELQYMELLQTNVFPIVIVDAHGVIAVANRAALAAFGDAIVGSQIDDTLGVALDGSGGQPRHSIEAIETADGVMHTYRLRVGNVRATGDNEGSRQLVFQDVTDEYRQRAEMRSYATLLLAAQEEERRHVAHEIHDDPLQRLIHLARRLESLGAEPGRAPASAALLEARLELLNVIGRLRDVARGLRPPGLDQLGLVAAVRGLLADVEDDADALRVDFVVSGSQVRLAADVELGAFRIIQEAVRNAGRHASARELRVDLHYLDDALRIRVVDDGVGFEVPRRAHADAAHLGLVGMRERASLLGGRLVVASARGKGTAIEADLPSARSAILAGR